jgi:hypothetical protein
MDWLLIIVLLSAPGTPAVDAGHMLDEGTCKVAGAGMVDRLEAANPGLDFAFACRHRGVAS